MQLSMHIAFISFTNGIEKQIMDSESDNLETMRGIDIDETMQELIDSFMQRYQEGLETKMTSSNYTFDRAELFEYHFRKITLNRGSSYIPSFDWLLAQKSIINPKNTDDNWCFLFATVIALNYQNIPNNPQRLPSLIPFVAK